MIELKLVSETINYIIDDARLLSCDVVNRKIESEKKGLPGLIVFDTVSVELVIKDSPLSNLFNISNITNLDSNKKYIEAFVRKRLNGVYYDYFSGIINYETIRYTDKYTVNFELVDKLSVLSLLEDTLIRGNDVTIGETEFIRNYSWDEYSGKRAYVHYALQEHLTEPHPIQQTYIFTVGDIIRNPKNTSEWILITYCEIVYLNNRYDLYVEYETVHSVNEIGSLTYVSSFTKKSAVLYGTDPCLLFNDNERAVAYDAIRIIATITKLMWPNISVINHLGSETFPISLLYYNELVSVTPFSEHPLDALKKLASSMECYIYVNNIGQLIIKGKNNLYESNLPAGRTINIGNALEYSINNYWDKLIDYCKVTVKTANGITGIGEKKLGNKEIKPRNKFEIEILAGSNIDTQLEADQYALLICESYMNFYSKKRIVYNLMIALDSNSINFNLTDNLQISNERYFIASMKTNIAENTVNIEAVFINDLNNS